MQHQDFILGIEELFLGGPLVHTEKRLPIKFVPIARAGSRFQNMGLELLPESTGFENTRLLVSHALIVMHTFVRLSTCARKCFPRERPVRETVGHDASIPLLFHLRFDFLL